MTFLKNGTKSNSDQKIWRTKGLRTNVLLGVISDIQRVCINPEDPMNVRNDPPQGTRPQAGCSSNFLMWIWGEILFQSSKKLPIKSLKPTLNTQERNTRVDMALLSVSYHFENCNLAWLLWQFWRIELKNSTSKNLAKPPFLCSHFCRQGDYIGNYSFRHGHTTIKELK